MHWRFIEYKDGRNVSGRTSEEAFKYHALWCLSTLKDNQPDDEEKISYLCNNSLTWITGPAEFRKYFAGEAVYNAYTEIKSRYNEFKKYYTTEQNKWIKSWLKNTK